MKYKISDIFQRCCGVLFVLVFVFIFGGMVLRGNLEPTKFIAAAVLLGVVWAISRFALPFVERLSQKQWRLLCGGALLLSLILIVGAGQLLRNDFWTCPFDAEAVYRTAVELARGEKPYYHDYFLTCDTNFFCMLLQFWLYRVVYLCGGTDFTYWCAGLNCVMLWLSVVFLCLIGSRLWGRRGFALMWLLCLFFVPLYALSSFVYTDTMAAPFVMACVWQAVRLWQDWTDKTKKAKLLNLALLGVLLGLAFWMKGNSAVLWIALAIWLFFLHPKSKTVLKRLGIIAYTLVFAFAVIFALKAVEHSIIDFSQYDALHTPTLHWLMMGSEGDGAFNADSYAYTGRYATLEERNEAVKVRLASNYKFLLGNPKALLWLLHTKAENCWGDPLFDAEGSNCYNLVQRTWLSEWMCSGGEQVETTKAFAMAYYLMLWLGACVTAVRGAAKGFGGKRLPLFLAVVTLFGNFCFFCLWEANSRYTFSMIGLLLVLCAAAFLERREK